ncbi:hypothetical protein Cenrod_1558 [Candidatus Symbiobacter mobilis CR]|uniref:Uncharacterized protein n=1 Tax=Candidatus Symbiobacter mobilis CR TaxID=946483 RepID=U5NBM9_9BURK|nr:hypothetical protein Cenrod_1558 [Candidatus Symbiobacter mobilis CR]
MLSIFTQRRVGTRSRSLRCHAVVSAVCSDSCLTRIRNFCLDRQNSAPEWEFCKRLIGVHLSYESGKSWQPSSLPRPTSLRLWEMFERCSLCCNFSISYGEIAEMY